MQFIYFCRRELWENDGSIKHWPILNPYLRATFLHILDLVDLMLTVFPNSTESKTCFTQLKLVKIDHRNSSKGTIINQLLGVRLLTADVGSYNPIGGVIAIDKC